jgi:hypothetical protein
MKAKRTAPKSKSGYVHARLTNDEQQRVGACAQARGLTVSKWVRETLLEALETSPLEARLKVFIAAETAAIRLSLEEWQQGRHLTEPEVQERIERLAIAAGLERAKATVSRLDAARRENGEAA